MNYNISLNNIFYYVICLSITLIVYYSSQFYIRVYRLPPGPIPLPIVGNLLEFVNTKQHFSNDLERICKKYGPIVTIWLGNTPKVFITDIDIAKQAFGRKEYCGRPLVPIFEAFVMNGRSGIGFSDYGPDVEALRQLSLSAIHEFSASERLNQLVVDCVDHTIDAMLKNEGFDKPFNPSDYTFNLFLNILSDLALARKYDHDHPKHKLLRYVIRDHVEENKSFEIIWSIFPLWRKIDIRFIRLMNKWNEFFDIVNKNFKNHYQDYDQSVMRDFSDILITAKNDAIKSRKQSATYLTDDNLAMLCSTLVSAGTSSSFNTFQWILLYMLYNKSIEQQLRREIETEIGDRMATQEDINRCHYVMAVIAEALRLRNVAPVSAPHKALTPTQLAGYTIPNGTELFVFQGLILKQSEHWSDPLVFRPERWLSNGKYLSVKPKAFIPFGVGRRVCVGEKLAIVNLFLVLVRFLQKTSEYDIQLITDGLEPLQPDSSLIHLELIPKKFKLNFQHFQQN